MLDLRDAKRKQEDQLNIVQQSFKQDLEIFALRPKIVTMFQDNEALFEPSMLHVEHQSCILYITVSAEAEN